MGTPQTPQLQTENWIITDFVLFINFYWLLIITVKKQSRRRLFKGCLVILPILYTFIYSVSNVTGFNIRILEFDVVSQLSLEKIIRYYSPQNKPIIKQIFYCKRNTRLFRKRNTSNWRWIWRRTKNYTCKNSSRNTRNAIIQS